MKRLKQKMKIHNSQLQRQAPKKNARMARKKKVAWSKFWSALQRYVNKTDDRPWCNPATWLNGERWDDQPAQSTGGPQRVTPDMIARGDFRRTPR